MADGNLVSDYMVRGVACASLWQPVSFARQQMLTNSFSYLPLLTQSNGQDTWCLLSDISVAKYLQSDDKKQRLGQTIEKAIQDDLLKVERAHYCCVDCTIAAALDKFNGHPLLIVDKNKPNVLLGIVTPFDLL